MVRHAGGKCQKDLEGLPDPQGLSGVAACGARKDQTGPLAQGLSRGGEMSKTFEALARNLKGLVEGLVLVVANQTLDSFFVGQRLLHLDKSGAAAKPIEHLVALEAGGPTGKQRVV